MQNKAISKEGVYVSVKTCKKFRQDRIPVILKTWSKYALNIGFYTDEKGSWIYRIPFNKLLLLFK